MRIPSVAFVFRHGRLLPPLTNENDRIAIVNHPTGFVVGDQTQGALDVVEIEVLSPDTQGFRLTEDVDVSR